MNLSTEKKIIPLFFATDNNYIPFLAVALQSLLENASKDYFYKIYILTTNLKKEYQILSVSELLPYAFTSGDLHE